MKAKAVAIQSSQAVTVKVTRPDEIQPELITLNFCIWLQRNFERLITQTT